MQNSLTTTYDPDFEALLEESYAAAEFERGDTVSGTVLSVNHRGLIVGVGSARDGFVDRNDLEKMSAEPEDFQVGQEIDVTIIRMEDEDGNLVLSVSQARQSEDWKKAEELLESQEVWPGFVADANRGAHHLIRQRAWFRACQPCRGFAARPERRRPPCLSFALGRPANQPQSDRGQSQAPPPRVQPA